MGPAQLASIGLTDLIGYLVPLIAAAVLGWAANDRKGARSVAEGVKCLLRARIIDLHGRTVGAGKPVTPDVKREAAAAYSAYHDLGGNDMATSLYHEIMNAPTTDNQMKEEQ